MLKFQNNNTTVIATFEDFILTTYVIIDELYHQFALPEVTKRRHVLDAKLSDSEIITISLCGELLGVDSENAWFSFVKKNYRHLFPKLCSRSRFNRTRRALMQTTELLIRRRPGRRRGTACCCRGNSLCCIRLRCSCTPVRRARRGTCNCA